MFSLHVRRLGADDAFLRRPYLEKMRHHHHHHDKAFIISRSLYYIPTSTYAHDQEKVVSRGPL